MVGRLVFLVDTNVWLELLLEQERAQEARQFFQDKEASEIFITEFALYSIAIILFRLKKDSLLNDFLSDTLEDSGISRIILAAPELENVITVGRRYNLDFDDAYQYVAAEKYNLTLVSFDSDFDGTERGRKTPAEILKS